MCNLQAPLLSEAILRAEDHFPQLSVALRISPQVRTWFMLRDLKTLRMSVMVATSKIPRSRQTTQAWLMDALLLRYTSSCLATYAMASTLCMPMLFHIPAANALHHSYSQSYRCSVVWSHALCTPTLANTTGIRVLLLLPDGLVVAELDVGVYPQLVELAVSLSLAVLCCYCCCTSGVSLPPLHHLCT